MHKTSVLHQTLLILWHSDSSLSRKWDWNWLIISKLWWILLVDGVILSMYSSLGNISVVNDVLHMWLSDFAIFSITTFTVCALMSSKSALLFFNALATGDFKFLPVPGTEHFLGTFYFLIKPVFYLSWWPILLIIHHTSSQELMPPWPQYNKVFCTKFMTL